MSSPYSSKGRPAQDRYRHWDVDVTTDTDFSKKELDYNYILFLQLNRTMQAFQTVDEGGLYRYIRCVESLEGFLRPHYSKEYATKLKGLGQGHDEASTINNYKLRFEMLMDVIKKGGVLPPERIRVEI